MMLSPSVATTATAATRLTTTQTTTTATTMTTAVLSVEDSFSTPAPAPKPNSKNSVVWTLPWILWFVFVYIFIIIWISYAIVQRYWIRMDWNDALPGLDKTLWRKISMKSHMTFGAVALVLAPIQWLLIPTPTSNNLLRNYIHVWLGRLFCLCGILSSLTGLWFIALKRRLVGGYNMTISFALAGTAIGYTCWKTWQTARCYRQAKTTEETVTVTTATTCGPSRSNASSDAFPKISMLKQRHRNWSIRAVAQIMAPALYRYWYVLMQAFHLYKTPLPLREGGYCDAHDQCPDYHRMWDSLYSWCYWISAGVVAEIIICGLPDVTNNNVVMNVTNHPEYESQPIITSTTSLHDQGTTDKEADRLLLAPLLPSQNQSTVAAAETVNPNRDNYGLASATSAWTEVGDNSSTGNVSTTVMINLPETETVGNPLVVNGMGCLLAILSVAVTGNVLLLMVLGKI